MNIAGEDEAETNQVSLLTLIWKDWGGRGGVFSRRGCQRLVKKV